MVITVTCPSCSASFPVDPNKIPEGGVKARCSSCGDIFRVEKPAPAPALPTLEELAPVAHRAAPAVEAPAPAPPPMPAPEPEPVPAFPPPLPEPVVDEAPAIPEPEPEPVAPEPAVSAPLPMMPPEPEPTFAPPPTPQPAADPFAQPAPFEEPAAAAPEAPAAPAGFTFGKRDPTDKAKRLARVLVSDMIMYNAERHQTALASGTLVQDFEDEIDKSWKEYVDQVGEELANAEGRQFWTDALNDILAKGEKVF
jgi:predicted Zn finger-like uncharacterized protein